MGRRYAMSKVSRSLGQVLAFSRLDRSSGISLTVATVAALIWATAAPGSYDHAWRMIPSFGHLLGLRFSVRDWINQGLMTLFFALVGLEMRREFSAGELASWRRAAVPVLAALGGMAAPAAIYTLVLHGSVGSKGWGIPMATDVAFALGALALLGAGVSPRLRVFLMTLAVADDIASIIVLVCFYTAHLVVWSLLLGIACLVGMTGLEIVRPAWITPQLVVGLVGWWGLARSGIEAAVIGVAIGALTLPSPVKGTWARLRGPRSWEHRIQPWLALAILPLFALANAGISLRASTFGASGTLTIFLAVLAARVVGKPFGITGAYLALRKLPSGRYDPGIATRGILGIGCLASIGFTVPLLVIREAFPEGPLTDSSTLGLLAGSVLGAIAGLLVLKPTKGLHLPVAGGRQSKGSRPTTGTAPAPAERRRCRSWDGAAPLGFAPSRSVETIWSRPLR